MNWKKGRALSVCFGAAMLLSASFGFAACDGGSRGSNLGEHEIGDRVEISFLCEANAVSEKAWIDLITAYNDGQGLEDGAYVTAKMQSGASSPSASIFTRGEDYAYNVVTVSDSQNSFQTLAIRRDSKHAPDGYFLNLTPYAEADEDFQKNTISDEVLDWWRMTFNQNARQGAGEEKHVIGEGQTLLGVPYGSNPQFNWYNERLFKESGINVISCEEERLAEAYPNVQPHGYAEYKEAPFEGAVQSKNLAGQDVYKVFNNRIGMNWEEQRYVFKCFTKEYNKASPTNYGFASEYWFNYGWSVGGDVMGFNGHDYDFTLMDDAPNYIVTKDGTKINGRTYKAGEIVLYEDKVNQSDIATMDGVYPIESTYNAVKEFLSVQVPSANTVDVKNGVTYKGYGVGTPELGSADNWFNTAQIVMVRSTTEGIRSRLEASAAADFNICPAETYREYEGGSVYYKGDETFANEYLKVIGETYENVEYTGELKKVDGTPIIGNTTTASISQGLVIPSCSDPEKYQAAWDFISWVATDGQQYIAYTNTVSPIASDVLFGDAYAGNEEIAQGKNLYAVAMMASNVSRGDWGYFENGSWVTDWSDYFNNNLRYGRKTISEFVAEKADNAKTALNNMYCVIKGIR